MAVDFIRNKTNSKFILQAQKQSKDIAYFTVSNIQEDITVEYVKQWAERNYRGNDKFLNWVKMVFRNENFLSFYKYLRYPLASAKLINEEIKPQLKRVFHSEDSYFKYVVNRKEVDCQEELNCKVLDKKFFDAILFEHNSIVIHDLEDINKPYREIVGINSVVAVESQNGVISQLAYLSELMTETGPVKGYSYIDANEYIFYNLNLDRELKRVSHDLGVCPADWVSSENFDNTNDIVKKSLFSYVKNDFEEFVFLKTLQRMTEPNGAIPITVKLKGNVLTKSGKSIDGVSDKEPMAAADITSQKANQGPTVTGSDNQLQAGTIVNVPTNKKADGSIDSDITKNYFHFHYIPVESLEYIKNRLAEIQTNIIISVLGDYQEQNTSAKNELQVSKSYANKEDRLRWLSGELTRIKKLSDYKTLALKYGKDNVSLDIFFGSDFFEETQSDLYSKLESAPNPIERRNILIRLAQTRNKFNSSKAMRESIMYKLIPYATDKDFDTAIARGNVEALLFELQTRFDYWLCSFEATYGDLVTFWDNMGDLKENEKLIIINNLIKNLIKDEQSISSTP